MTDTPDKTKKEEPSNQPSQPKGELIFQVYAMPENTNANGVIFGGWIMSQMDLAGGLYAKQFSRSRVVTVAAESIRFIEPVQVGDVIRIYGEIARIGNTSITVNLEVWDRRTDSQEILGGDICMVTKSAFTYVAIDEDNNLIPVNRD